MAKRSRSAAPKKSGSVVPVLLAVGAVGALAILLMPKKASAATPPGKSSPNTFTSNGATITVLSSGTNPASSPIPIPSHVITDVAPGHYGVYLQTFDASGKGVFPGDPITADSATDVAVQGGNLQQIFSDGAFASYFSGVDPSTQTPYLTYVKGGKTLIWTSDSKGNIVNWWLTQWS